MRYKEFGKTGMQVSEMTLGTWGIGGVGWDDNPKSVRQDAIRAAVEAGVNFFDTAPAYNAGAAERCLGEALADMGVRDKMYISTKCGNVFVDGVTYRRDGSAAGIRRQCEDSLRNLRTDYVDLMLIHWPDPNTPFAETMAELTKLKEEGKIRHVGVSNFSQAQMEEAEVKRRLAQEKLDSYKEQYKADQDACSILTPQMEKRGKIIEKHAKLETLYKLLSGNMSGNRMDLETFVQRYYLEKILYAANRRFSDMSAGQFELRMVDAANAGKGKNRGLDLMVYSNVTGKEREVRTLSGGESFMAALSLALGMADQIQESSASINLDVMFIDEGFGSLDEHSREQAVKVLQELAGGSKLIGIISHVTELKQEIEDQLIVTKDEKGSHVRWQIS